MVSSAPSLRSLAPRLQRVPSSPSAHKRREHAAGAGEKRSLVLAAAGGERFALSTSLARRTRHVLAILFLTACSAVDRVDRTEFQPVTENEFIFLARTSLGDSPDPGAAAERERLDWIGGDLVRHGMCPHGWVLVERTPLRRGREGFLGYPVSEIQYRGRCADAPGGKAAGNR